MKRLSLLLAATALSLSGLFATAGPAHARCNPEFEEVCQIIREACRITGKCVI